MIEFRGTRSSVSLDVHPAGQLWLHVWCALDKVQSLCVGTASENVRGEDSRQRRHFEFGYLRKLCKTGLCCELEELQSLVGGVNSEGGTNLGAGLSIVKQEMESFSRDNAEGNTKCRMSLVIVTDGETHDTEISKPQLARISDGDGLMGRNVRNLVNSVQVYMYNMDRQNESLKARLEDITPDDGKVEIVPDELEIIDKFAATLEKNRHAFTSKLRIEVPEEVAGEVDILAISQCSKADLRNVPSPHEEKLNFFTTESHRSLLVKLGLKDVSDLVENYPCFRVSAHFQVDEVEKANVSVTCLVDRIRDPQRGNPDGVVLTELLKKTGKELKALEQKLKEIESGDPAPSEPSPANEEQPEKAPAEQLPKWKSAPPKPVEHILDPLRENIRKKFQKEDGQWKDCVKRALDAYLSSNREEEIIKIMYHDQYHAQVVETLNECKKKNSTGALKVALLTFHHGFGRETRASLELDKQRIKVAEESADLDKNAKQQESIRASIALLKAAQKYVKVWQQISRIELLLQTGVFVEGERGAFEAQLQKLYEKLSTMSGLPLGSELGIEPCVAKIAESVAREELDPVLQNFFGGKNWFEIAKVEKGPRPSLAFAGKAFIKGLRSALISTRASVKRASIFQKAMMEKDEK